jgi:hypothetical protein
VLVFTVYLSCVIFLCYKKKKKNVFLLGPVARKLGMPLSLSRSDKFTKLMLFHIPPIVWSTCTNVRICVAKNQTIISQKKKKMWFRRGPFLKVGTLVKFLVSSARERRELNATTHIINKYGEIGSPCRIPLVGEICLV